LVPELTCNMEHLVGDNVSCQWSDQSAMDAKHDWRQFGVILPLNTEYNFVKEFLKSVKIWQSYCEKFGGFLFLEHSVYYW